MNMWGFHPSILDEIEGRFPAWLTENVAKNPMKCEYFLPLIPNWLLQEGKASVAALPTTEKWYGVIYAADMPKVRSALAAMREADVYPEQLWR